MDPNRLTEKSQEALAASQRLAGRLGHRQLDVEHLLLALLDQEGGLATSILSRAGVPVEPIKLKVQRELEKFPRSTSGAEAPENIHVTARFNRLLAQAEEEARRMKDEYVSVEHLLMALFDEGGAAARILK